MPEQRPEETPPQRPRRPLPRQVDSFVEQRIREAVERGDFDNLESRGKPLSLDLKDAIDHEAWFVNRTMKSLGAVPAWIELGKEIDTAEERLRWMRSDFERWLHELSERLLPAEAEVRAKERPGIELRFEDRFARFAKQAHELRALIDRFNLEVPVRKLEKPGVWVAHELRRLSEPYQALRDELGWDAEPLPDEPSPPPAPTPEPQPDALTRKRRLLDIWRRAGKR